MSWDSHPRTREDGDDEVTHSETEVLEILPEESREVLPEQISPLNDIDDKAMRSVRTSVLLLGLVISTTQLSGGVISPNEIGDWPVRFTTAGVSFLILSIIFETLTYSVSDIEFGVGDDHRADARNDYTQREWLDFLLDEYNQWTTDMSRTNRLR